MEKGYWQDFVSAGLATNNALREEESEALMQRTEVALGPYQVRLYLFDATEAGTQDIQVEAIHPQGHRLTHRLTFAPHVDEGTDTTEKEQESECPKYIPVTHHDISLRKKMEGERREREAEEERVKRNMQDTPATTDQMVMMMVDSSGDSHFHARAGVARGSLQGSTGIREDYEEAERHASKADHQKKRKWENDERRMNPQQLQEQRFWKKTKVTHDDGDDAEKMLVTNFTENTEGEKEVEDEESESTDEEKRRASTKNSSNRKEELNEDENEEIQGSRKSRKKRKFEELSSSSSSTTVIARNSSSTSSVEREIANDIAMGSLSGDALARLPVEILQLIFSYLPIQTLSRLNLVSRHWKMVLEDHTFWHQTFNQRFGISGFLNMSWKQHCISAEGKKQRIEKSRARRLLWAAKEGLYKYFEETLDDPELESEVMPLGKILRVAASNGHKSIIQLLHQHDWPVLTQRDNGGRTALHYAAKNNRKDLVEYLIDNGVDIQATDNFGDTPLIFAAHHGHACIAKILIERGTPELINMQNHAGNSALFFALQDGNKAIVELLLDHNADINQRNVEGNTALIFAAIDGDVSLVERLLSMGADPTAKGRNGNTPLVFAVDNAHSEVAKLLLAHGIDVNTQNDHGVTPLIFAAQGGHKDLVELLLSHNAQIDHRSHKGNCALRLSARNGHTEIVRLLLSRGASPSLPTRAGETALSSAKKNGHLSIVEVIEEFMNEDLMDSEERPEEQRNVREKVVEAQQQPQQQQQQQQQQGTEESATSSSSPPPCPNPPPPSPASRSPSPPSKPQGTPSPPQTSSSGNSDSTKGKGKEKEKEE